MTDPKHDTPLLWCPWCGSPSCWPRGIVSHRDGASGFYIVHVRLLNQPRGHKRPQELASLYEGRLQGARVSG